MYRWLTPECNEAFRASNPVPLPPRPPGSILGNAVLRVEDAVLKDHVAHCVEGAIASGDGAEQRRKVQELLTVLTQRER